ncbi:MAG: hypothetical protein LBL66_04955 [Clostridiales bacterium]|jgi:uncharacterized phage infection (PIP) family protein YhgE|nr:hypothetical protein [Clostridiales bacterium]
MDNEELKSLIGSFKAYRDLLTPIQKNLADFIGTYEAMRENIDKLNAAFGGDVRAKLDDIFRQMSGQAGKAADLSSQIDRFGGAANRYASEVGALGAMLSKIEERLNAVNAIEGRAEAQISRLDAVLAEKTKSYNLKELQTALDSYNRDVRRVGEFINKDVADTLFDSRNKLETIKSGLDGVVKAQNGESANLAKLMESFTSSEQLLKKITEKKDVDEAYIFEILDRWAESRRVKTR